VAARRAVHTARNPRGGRRVARSRRKRAWVREADLPSLPLAPDALRAYLKQAREETGTRLVPRCYTEDDKPNKFWMAFAKRKFMNKEL